MTCLVWRGGGHVTAAQLRPVRPRGGGRAGRRVSPQPGVELQWCLFTSQLVRLNPYTPGGGEPPVCPSAWVWTCMYTCVAVSVCVGRCT